jgi:hypothetical protein
LQQHNGVLKQGAWKTKRKGRPWQTVVVVHGFATEVEALQWEWAWQNPDLSLRIRGAIGDAAAQKLKRQRGVAAQLRILQTLLLDCDLNDENVNGHDNNDHHGEGTKVHATDGADDDSDEGVENNDTKVNYHNMHHADTIHVDDNDENSSDSDSTVVAPTTLKKKNTSLSLYFLEQTYLDMFLKVLGVDSAMGATVPVPCYVSTFENMPFWTDRNHRVPIRGKDELSPKASAAAHSQEVIELDDSESDDDENDDTSINVTTMHCQYCVKDIALDKEQVETCQQCHCALHHACSERLDHP